MPDVSNDASNDAIQDPNIPVERSIVDAGNDACNDANHEGHSNTQSISGTSECKVARISATGRLPEAFEDPNAATSMPNAVSQKGQQDPYKTKRKFLDCLRVKECNGGGRLPLFEGLCPAWLSPFSIELPSELLHMQHTLPLLMVPGQKPGRIVFPRLSVLVKGHVKVK